MFKNVASQKLAVFAYDTSAEAPKTGDAANITAQISKDGGAAAATNDVNPTELDATNMKGIYLFDLTQAESNGDLIALSPVSATADITLEPVFVYTQTVMRGTDSAATSTKQDTMETTLNDVPNTAEFEARTLTAQQTRDAMKLSPSAGAATADSIDGKSDRISDVQEADTEIDLTTDPAQGTLNYKTKGTSTVILKKNLKRPNGTPVTSTDHQIAAEENVTI